MYGNLYSWDGASYTSLNYPNARSEGLTEDSQNRLWSLGEYYSLSYYNDANANWTEVDFIGLGASIRKDPSRDGTVWACSGYQVLRTDGIYNYSKVVDDFPELDPQSDFLTGAVPASGGIAWIGSNKGLFKLDANTNTYQFFSPGNSNIPGENLTPLAYSPDGRLWFTTFGSETSAETGLCWFDGSEFGFFPVEEGGLLHAQIKDMEVREFDGGYELWMSCLSRGVVVLTVVNESVGIEPIALNKPALFMQNYPNPFTDHTSISFSLPADGNVAIDIFDISGRIVKNLTNSVYNAGTSAVAWNGTDNSGNRVNPGIFVCRLISGKESISNRLVVK
jgi:hypothetical protein